MRIRSVLLLAASVAMLACVERGLPSPEHVADLALVRDLSIPDLAPADLARAEGVRCVGALCDEGQVCCALSGAIGACVNAGPGPGLNDCPLGGSGLRCDGPEDCRQGRECVALLEAGTVRSTYCRAGTPDEGARVCHEDRDCPPRSWCAPVASSPAGLGELAICSPAD